MEWVVRAGEAKAPDLMKGYSEHDQVPNLYGFSVQYQPGMSWEELARAGRFPNAQISIAYDTDLHRALQSLGYDMRLVKSPGKGYHHTFVVIYDVNGMMSTAQLYSSFPTVWPGSCTIPFSTSPTRIRFVRGGSHEAHPCRFQHAE